MNIRDMKPGDQITGFYLLKTVKVGETRSQSKYLDLTLGDKTGEINAKLWDATPEHEVTYKPSLLVKVQASVETYQDKPQLKIIRIRPTDLADGVALADFIKAAPSDPTALVESIESVSKQIGSETLRTIVTYCIHKAGKALFTFPAAKSNHHNYYAGLAYHMNRMLELADAVCQLRPILNADLLKAAIILHDIAKTEEYEAENGIASGFTTRGSLIGHISLVYGWIIEACLQYGIDQNSEMVTLLQHTVLAHHGQLEWGSPVQPQTPEAVAIHYIDQLDAKLQAVEDALAELPDNERWTKQLFILDKARVFKSNGGVIVDGMGANR
ncbi:3'-5' exoribonuclease YhaM family protein [Brevibacillus borstelensis]|uniref:3'-5' exoribonuclease YhaM family protein n=1 Tax=Brevibacillus borstelensis TaxID=45462 RepID=UPI000689AD4A|nr:HD domain-containing protein [Brevibacillus borstelensis]KKX53269.1 phosphohydrolase [Brevibacillus borstelensis cifa_chp40]